MVELNFKAALEICPKAVLTLFDRQMLQASVADFNTKYKIFEVGKFPYGALKIRLTSEFFSGIRNLKNLAGISGGMLRVTFFGELKSSDDFMALMFMNDCVFSAKEALGFSMSTHGDFGYVEYQRQDRVAVQGDNISVAVVDSLLSQLDSYSVVCPHSNYLNNDSKFAEWRIAERAIVQTLKNPYIVAPDKGSIKRTKAFCDNTGLSYAGHIDKVRNPVDGVLVGFEIASGFMLGYEGSNYNQVDFVMYDDICDGGGTFVAVADLLRKFDPNSVNLFVYHGLFTRGVDALHNIDAVWCTRVDEHLGEFSLLVDQVK